VHSFRRDINLARRTLNALLAMESLALGATALRANAINNALFVIAVDKTLCVGLKVLLSELTFSV
jgi:hypothetical protein